MQSLIFDGLVESFDIGIRSVRMNLSQSVIDVVSETELFELSGNELRAVISYKVFRGMNGFTKGLFKSLDGPDGTGFCSLYVKINDLSGKDVNDEKDVNSPEQDSDSGKIGIPGVIGIFGIDLIVSG